MTQLDYTFERQLTLVREEAKEEGREQGLKEMMMESIANLMENGKMKAEVTCQLLGVDYKKYLAIRNNEG